MIGWLALAGTEAIGAFVAYRMHRGGFRPALCVACGVLWPLFLVVQGAITFWEET